MAPTTGIFVLASLNGETGQAVREIQEKYDLKLARQSPPHVTIVGSSGLGAIVPDTSVKRIREALEPITRTTAPLSLTFGAPVRFMQTDIVSLPLDPHGPLRTLHERIATSGLPFKQARFQFTPHCTINFYRTLTRATEKEMLALRVTTPAEINRLQVWLTRDPQPSRLLLELDLLGS